MAKKARFQAKIGGINLNGTSQTGVLKKIIKRIEKGKKIFIVTPNPEFIIYAQKHPWFKKILNQADFAIPDGVGLVWASRFLAFRPLAKIPSRPIVIERISGTDLMEKLCQKATKRGWSIYLLGGQPGVAKKTLRVLKKRYPGLKGWAEAGPKLSAKGGSSSGGEIGNLVKRINSKHPDLLFVAFGMGRQEKFIWNNWNQFDVKLAMGVGGAFDFISGRVPRAPKWAQDVGFEWLFRFIHEPWRWRRQLALIEFGWLVIREKLF